MKSVQVIDSIMGSGKTTAMIEWISDSTNWSKKFLVVTPYLTEVSRYLETCHGKFKQPKFTDKGNKHSNLEKLLEDGENVVTTHALFLDFDSVIGDLCQKNGYYLIIDETPDLFGVTNTLAKADIDLLMNTMLVVEPETGKIRFKEEYANYSGCFSKIKKQCDRGSLMYNRETNTVYNAFPFEIFEYFKQTYLMTYLFQGSLMRCYFDYFKIPYEMKSIRRDSEDFHYSFVPWHEAVPTVNYRELIKICDNKKMNLIGKDKNALSKSWYSSAADEEFEKLQHNIYNHTRNICKVKQKDILWTTFKDYKDLIGERGFKKSYAPLNQRASNEYLECTCVCYLVNRFINPFVKNFFVRSGVKMDEDAYALSEMLQFIWRSAIRTGKPINLYIPSSRMRGLLEKWIEENSVPA